MLWWARVAIVQYLSLQFGDVLSSLKKIAQTVEKDLLPHVMSQPVTFSYSTFSV